MAARQLNKNAAGDPAEQKVTKCHVLREGRTRFALQNMGATPFLQSSFKRQMRLEGVEPTADKV